jgi:hypothetical protein
MGKIKSQKVTKLNNPKEGKQMAELRKEFNDFHDRIVLGNGQKESLRKSRNAIRDRIRKYFKEIFKVTSPRFYMQGSFAMGTTVNPLDGEFDIDDGVYLQHLDENDNSNWPVPDTVHQWIVKATDGHTKEKPMDKRTCVRIRYAGQYHVDLPIYAKYLDEQRLAEKGENGWHQSDSKALTDWFINQVNNKGEQLRRTVRFIKAWADFQSGRRGKMPSGLILTVLAVENFRLDEKDDISLSKTLAAISNVVKSLFIVFNPIDGTEELTARLTDMQKERFQQAIADFSSDALKAVDTDDCEYASKLWRLQFGDRFPVVESKDNEEQKKENVAKLATIYAAKNPPKPWGNR